MWPIGARKNATLAQTIDHVPRLPGRSLASVAIEHQVNPEKQSRAPHIADQCVLPLQRLQAVHKVGAYAQCALLQLLFLEHVQNGKTRRASHRIAAKRTEKLHPIVK